MAPRFSRLASTISRDDIIAVIGASPAELAGGSAALLDFRFMREVCQQNPAMPSQVKPLTLSSISSSLCERFSFSREYGRSAGTEETMDITQRDRDLGTAYAIRSPATRTELTAVGRGTPMGELLRRYWHPIGLVNDATDTPRKVRILGEDLILFRDRHGRPGLLHARCCHR